MHDVDAFLPELSSHHLGDGTQAKFTNCKIEMPMSSNDARRRAEENDRAAPHRQHCARGLLSNDEGAETVGPPGFFESSNLDIDCSARTPALHAINDQ